MTLTVSSKKLGLLFAGLFVAVCANILFSEPALAANATWINRSTIKYDAGSGMQYFVDTDSLDGNFTFESTVGPCKDLITFDYNSGFGASEGNFLFYYDEVRWEADKPGNATYVFKDPLTSPVNPGACNEAFTASVAVDNPNNAKRVSFVLNTATRKITHVLNGATFDFAGTTPGSWSENPNRDYYVNNADPSLCKGTIVMVEADPHHTSEPIRNNGPFGSGRVPGSSMLYMGVSEGRGEDVDLSRISESFKNTVNFIPNEVTCKINDSQVEGNGSKYPLMPTGTGHLGVGDYVEWLSAGGFSTSGQIQTDGNLNDDAYIVFVGNSTDNTIPAAAGGTPSGATPSGPGSPIDVCQDNVSGMGHILCPLLNGFDSLMQSLYRDFILPFLTVPPLTTIVGLKQVSDSVLAIANILFVIIFFVVVFSQATSIGITNYGIKSLLPKLIAVAVLANLSFYVCVLLVDIANILGAGITSLIAISVGGLPAVNVDFNLAGSFSDLFAGAATVGFIGLAVSAGGGFIAVIAALAIPIVLATVVTVIALVIRLVLIVGFVALAPIIFMGFILPGTSRLSGRLLMGFMNLLWVGPIIMALVALNGVVAYIISLVLA